MRFVLNWPLAFVCAVLIVVVSACWLVLVLRGIIPPRVPSWILVPVGGGSLTIGALVPVVQWIRAHVETEAP